MLIHPLVGLGGGWGIIVINHLPSKYSFLGFSKKQKKKKTHKKTRTDDDSDSDTDNELFLTKDNWLRFIVVKSASEERPLIRLSPFAAQKGFQAIAGTLKSTKRWVLLCGVFEKNPGRKSAENS